MTGLDLGHEPDGDAAVDDEPEETWLGDESDEEWLRDEGDEGDEAGGGQDAVDDEPEPTTLPMVVVAGRPNVGKSSLVNRIVGERVAVVEEEAGVTRDRKVLTAEWSGYTFNVTDTGGWLAGGNALDAKVSAQSEKAVADAHVVLFVVDVTTGVTEEDLAAARVIRRAGPPVILVVNKVDDSNREASAWDFLSLGLGEPLPVSALHGRGTGDLLDVVIDLLPLPLSPDTAFADDRSSDRPAHGGPNAVPRIALVGRPNVGKSTLFNRLLGEERSVVHDMPGTTRDAIDTVVDTDEGPICFIDTAGLRRPSKTDHGTEQHSALRALRALERADIAVLVIDATLGASHQDQRLAERIGVSGCPAVVVLNKWDLVDPDDRDDVLAGVADRLAFLGAAPVLKVSALTGKGAHRLLPALRESVESYHRRVPTGALNRAVQEMQQRQPAPRARIRYVVQGAIDPPTFTLFCSARLPAPYLRFVERTLRERFDLGATPIKLRVRIGGK
ncbi:MAG TPA: ribosome biogenesis GTPase Der [Acidimicrobiales bacterium]|nr:ribosome biogenesis GTPase Der [Acidimicrobiales bacterium]